MKMNLFILAALVVTGQCYITYDCSGGDREKEGYVDITETDPVDTVLFVFNNSHGDLQWMASLNSTNGDYLSQFFKSSQTADADYTHALKLAKILDLELLQLELVSPGELFTEDGSNMITLDVLVICSAETREVNEWKFKINIRSVNEFYPQFIGSPFRTAVSESVALGTLVFDIGSKATDLDAGHTNLTFSVAPYMITQFDGSGYVDMNNTNKGTLVLTKALDFESFLSTGRTYMFINVTATDDGGFTSATSVNVSVTDSNDQSIQLVYPDCARPCGRANYSVTINESFVGLLLIEPIAILAEDLDTLNDSVIYSLVDEHDKEFFDIDEYTGALFKTAPLVNDSFGYSIEVQVRALETTDEGHFLDFNVTIFIKERLPERKSLAECAAICEQTDECLSLNYNKTQQQCHITDSYPSEGIKDVLIEQVLGWEIYYKQNPACEFSYTTYFATEYVNTITSPNYPNNYNNYVNQRWLIIKPRVTSTLYLDFTDFKLEDDHDHVYVYNGACLDAPNHANVTANTRYITYSSGLYALVNFKSDYSITFRGFSMDFYVGNN